MSLGALLGKVKKEKQVEKAPEMDELEAYLMDTDVPDIDDPVLDWWKVKARKWPALGQMAKQYFAAPASTGVYGARLLRCGEDAQRPAEVSQGHYARALPVCCLQHGLSGDTVTRSTSGGAVRGCTESANTQSGP